jgi:hypothetical protein
MARFKRRMAVRAIGGSIAAILLVGIGMPSALGSGHEGGLRTGYRGHGDPLFRKKINLLRGEENWAQNHRSSHSAAKVAIAATTPGPPANNLQILGCVPGQGECGGTPLSFSVVTFVPTTQWTTLVGNDYLVVWAGADPINGNVGAIKVLYVNVNTDQTDSGSGTFDVPSEVGTLTITGVANGVVSFSYAGGQGSFSLSSDQFSVS